jgi:hypothetical protein
MTNAQQKINTVAIHLRIFPEFINIAYITLNASSFEFIALQVMLLPNRLIC